MKVYVLTHCAAEENYTPEVYKTKEKAVERLKEVYDECVGDESYIDDCELYDESAVIVYPDDTYDRLDIFEVEMEE